MIKIDNKPNILVIGDLMIDQYLWGSSDRVSPEAPVPVVEVTNSTTVLGGAGNAINNLISLGSKVGVISVVGKDETAKELKSMLDKTGAKTFLIEQASRKTSKKTRVMASKTQVIRYDTESKNSISFDSEKRIFSKYQEILNGYDIILLSDYGKGVLSKDLCQKLIQYANKYNKKVIIHPKGKDYKKYEGAYLLVYNKKEAEMACKIKIEDKTSLKKALKKIKEKINIEHSIITLSEDGISILDNEKVIIKPTISKEVCDITGVGDTVISALGFSLSLGNDINTSLEFANNAASVVISKVGSATATIDEVMEYYSQSSNDYIEDKINNIEFTKFLSEKLKLNNKKVVFTNGCFDILHKGHVSYLNTAKSFGDILIVGLNSDDSVKKLKGKDRPLTSQEDRAYILAGLQSVDYVVIFDDDTPLEIIKQIKPDVLVKGSDYEGKEIVGSSIAKETKLVPFIDGRSSTNIINKIKG